MKDLHSHLLYDTDDGVSTLEESIKIINKLKQGGVTDILLTPHYINESEYTCNNKEKYNKLNILKKQLDELDISINLYMGNEVYLYENILKDVLKGNVTTLNNTRYILVELPMHNKLNNVKDIFFKLINDGFIIILAHPERYTEYYNDFEFFTSLVNMGILLQGNLRSLDGYYGENSKKMLTKLLKMDMIYFMGTDIHRYNNAIDIELNECTDKLNKIVGFNRANELLSTNFDKVIKDEDIFRYPIKEIGFKKYL